MTVAQDLRRMSVAVIVFALAVIVSWSASASAHSLESTTISVRVTNESVEATISLAVEALDEALGTSYLEADRLDEYAGEIIAYIDEHLSVASADGTVWGEAYDNPVRESIEGIESFSVDVVFDIGQSDPASFIIDYDAIIESIDHEGVVVLTDPDNVVSAPGIIERSGDTVTIDVGSTKVANTEMVRFGFSHVIDGADHLLFLATLLLPAPLVATSGRWRRSGDPIGTIKNLVHVITAFTLGHSMTLVASSLGWVSLPSRPVEILIATSVGVAAIHAIRPLVTHGDVLIAAGFGLVHGLAFAGILADLGIGRSASVGALFAFNIGIELSQLLTAALVFPSLWLMSRTRFYAVVRVSAASAALAASVGWTLDRFGLLNNPFAWIEVSAIHHPWRIVAALAALALACVAGERLPHLTGTIRG